MPQFCVPVDCYSRVYAGKRKRQRVNVCVDAADAQAAALRARNEVAAHMGQKWLLGFYLHCVEVAMAEVEAAAIIVPPYVTGERAIVQ